MIIPIPYPVFIRNLFIKPEETQEDREIRGHIKMINIQASITKESEQRHQLLFSQLTDKEKKMLDKMPMNMFHAGYYDYLDNQSNNMEKLISKRTFFLNHFITKRRKDEKKL